MSVFGLKQRFLLVIAIVIIAFAMVFCLQIIMQQRQSDSWQALQEKALERQNTLFTMRSEIGYGAMIHNFKNYVLRGQDKYQKRTRDNHAQLSESISYYRSLGGITAEEIQALNDIQSVADSYLQSLNNVQKLVAKPSPITVIDRSVRISDQTAIDGFAVLEKHYIELSQQYTQMFEADAEDTFNYSLMAVSFALLCILIATLTLYRYVVSRTTQLHDAVHNISQGEADLSQRIEISGSDEFAQVADELNLFMKRMAELVGSIRGLSENFTIALQEIHNNALGNADRSARQKDDTESLAAAVEQMATTAHMVAQNTSTAVDAAGHAQTEFSNGVESLTKSVESIVQLSGDVQNASEVIDRLKHRSDEIGEIVTVIGGIAEQTNLLALNAAIEAARAGEQGRGFAVVADEVRTLAGRTQQSTEQIRQMIDDLQAGTAQAVQVMDDSESRSDNAVELVKHAEHSLQEIATEIGRISELNLSISSASDEQSSVTDELNRNIHNIFQLSGETATAVASNKTAVEQLTKRADELEGLVQRFKL
ncbi:methyl-accepting chemotaxis protein [Amphritea balenae]|uniref:Methyl-accepting chemotaxis protein n=1 Tax=Amphritea balenae TaxID=452629 RepID=A0A3P1SII8_9GAMM|nr:methyl-accepting chemotaxis protein [Amphritea balenae]RRC96847.1 methyl-accepting chemotaxis protein [Amphritea balenae]GGK61200.1 hypothetical protein GCM10007941_09290 [Amphritea balenae]